MLGSIPARSDRRTDGLAAELEEHLRDEHSTLSRLLEPMLELSGFEIEQADYGSRRIYAEYVCVKARDQRPCVALQVRSRSGGASHD